MKCPKCNSPLPKNKEKCDRCGFDFTIYKKIIRISNMCYNDGLAKAKVRNLSGAVNVLKKSLKLNKNNIDARNLLGIIYYEMGETVRALGEWVLSKHFQSENNDADRYMEEVQSNPTQFEMANQAVKKYNAALLSAKQGNDDLAIIQLKKVTSLNPKFVRSHQLLALMYLKTGDKEKARKYLLKAKKIDVSNTLTLKYLKETEISKTTSDGREIHSLGRTDTTDSFMPVSNYKEDKPNIFVFINLIIGIVIGVLVTFCLIVPTVKNHVRDEYNTNAVDYNDKLAVQTANITTLEKEKAALDKANKELQKKLDEISIPSTDENMYDNLFEGISLYIADDKKGAAAKLSKIDETKIDNKTAKELFTKIKSGTFEESSKKLYEDGHNAYLSGKYEEALTTLQTVLDLSPDNVDAIYFIGRTYQQMGDNEKAKENYTKIIEEYPDSNRVVAAKGKLNGLN